MWYDNTIKFVYNTTSAYYKTYKYFQHVQFYIKTQVYISNYRMFFQHLSIPE
jgi:hypothetical protein